MTKAATDIMPFLAVANAANPSIIEVESALGGARSAVDAAKADHDLAEASYRQGLLSVDEPGLRKLADARTAAAVRQDRGEALVEALQARLVEARAAEAEGDRRIAYTAAQKAAKDAAETLKGYPAAVEKLIAIVRAVNAAEMLIESVNASLPKGAAPISSPEFELRGRPALPRKILSEETVDLWCAPGTSGPVSDEYQAQISPAGRRARPMPRNQVAHIPLSADETQYIRRSFVRRTFLPERLANSPLPLAADMRLPAFEDGVFALDCEGIIFHRDIADRLASVVPVVPKDDPRADPRRPLVEFEPVPPGATSAAAA